MRTPCHEDPEMWVSDQAASRHEAMKACRPCPIIAECLAGAIERREMFAVWGGKDFSHATTRPALPPKPEQAIKHGTEGGHRAHLRRKVPMCEPCRQARQRARADWPSEQAS